MELVIILGCRLTDKCTGQEIVGRSRVAASLMVKNYDILAIASGGKTEPRCEKSEARVIADTLLKYGVDPSRVILEERSRSTVGNAFFTRNVLNEMGIHPLQLYLVTSCYHSKRTEMIFSRFFDSSLLCDVCFPYNRSDETESMKYVRDMELIQRMGNLEDRDRILNDFREWL